MAEYPVAYNGSETGNGGDSLTEDLNIYYSVGGPKERQVHTYRLTDLVW
jgi:hypothetical protein